MARVQILEVDLSGIKSKEDLHAHLQEVLGFPSWYGWNWDAFWDAITGLVEMPEQLIIRGWPEFQASLPADAAQLAQCLSEMSAEYPESASRVSYA